MSVETMRCPKCGHDCGFDPSSGDVWCPTEGGGCGYQYSPEPKPAPRRCFCGAPGREYSATLGTTVLCDYHASN